MPAKFPFVAFTLVILGFSASSARAAETLTITNPKANAPY